MLARRNFLLGIGAVLAAPAIVRASSLMKLPASKIVLDPKDVLYGNDLSCYLVAQLERLDREVCESHALPFKAISWGRDISTYSLERLKARDYADRAAARVLA